MKTIKVAMCQIFSLDGDRDGNFVRIENAVLQAKDAGAEIICFPETIILGWINSDAHKRAYPIPGKDSGRLCKLAIDYKSYLCVGLAEKDGSDLYDSVILIDDNGQILLEHRKINLLSELMSPPYTAGKNVDVVETRYGRIGLLICADTHKDEILNCMATLKPDLLLIPFGYAAEEDQWPGHGKELEKVVRKAAKKTGAPVVGTNLVGEITKGPWKGRIYGGQSIAVDKTGKSISIAKDRDRDINIFQINTSS
ncbi:MAG: carbon-nitrogen hydrolase family protein [Planctomycetes bacterium]|nr:carbon-nitrogen hydrolase family protein [Planctomycetota bacterium]